MCCLDDTRRVMYIFSIAGPSDIMNCILVVLGMVGTDSDSNTTQQKTKQKIVYHTTQQSKTKPCNMRQTKTIPLNTTQSKTAPQNTTKHVSQLKLKSVLDVKYTFGNFTNAAIVYMYA